MLELASSKRILQGRMCINVCGILVGIVIAFSTSAQEAMVTLESSVVGNQEQPKVLYIVPWKSPGTSADLYQPVNSQLSAIFDHVERSELRRQMHYLDLFKMQNELNLKEKSE